MLLKIFASGAFLYIPVMRFSRVFVFLLCSFITGFSQPADSLSAEMSVCEFDKALVNAFIQNDLSGDQSSAVLDLVSKAVSIKHETCGISSQAEELSSWVSNLFNRTKSDVMVNGYDVAYTKYVHLIGQEENGRTFTDEENAVYNIALDYEIAKYDAHFANVKRHMLKNGKKEYLLDEFLVTKSAVKAGRTVLEEMNVWYGSWAKLWLMSEGASKDKSYYEDNYGWLRRAVVNFKKVYPNSKYGDALEGMLNQELLEFLVSHEEKESLEHEEKEEALFAMSFGAMVGRSLLSDNMKPADENVSIGVPVFRVQFNHVVLQLQGDMYVGDGGYGAMGVNGLLGYNKTWGTVGVDLMAGFGFDQFFMGEDTVTCKLLMGAVQAFKRILFSSHGALTPRIQWSIKGMTFRRRKAFVNQFYAGLTLDFLAPLSEMK